MNTSLMVAIAQIAAPAGLAIGVFFYIARNVIAKKIFPNLTQVHSFRIIMFVLFCALMVALAGMAAWAYVSHSNKNFHIGIKETYPPLSMEALKNLTYKIDDDAITLQDGKREFVPETERTMSDKSIVVFLTDHAFGDLDGDGSSDAIAVLQATDGGSGIYYYLAVVLNDKGTAKQYGTAYLLGDRLQFRSVSIHDVKVTVELMMHGPHDGLCCPTQFRTLVFMLKDQTFQCTTNPCSEV